MGERNVRRKLKQARALKAKIKREKRRSKWQQKRRDLQEADRKAQQKMILMTTQVSRYEDGGITVVDADGIVE